MIYSVLVDRKTKKSETFDYIFDLEIEPLTLVEVPFGSNKRIRGIVIAKKNKSPFANKNILHKLSNSTIFTANQLNLAKDMSANFLSTIAAALFSFLPNLNKSDLATMGAKTKPVIFKQEKTELFLADRSTRFMYFGQTIAHESQNLIILPTINQVNDLTKALKKLSPNINIKTWYGGLKSTEKSRIWQGLLKGESATIIGTRHALFLPFTRLRTIIIDDPINFSYQEDQSPYYSAYPTVRLAAKIYGANLIVGEDTPDLTTFTALELNKIEIKEVKSSSNIYAKNLWNKIMSDFDTVEVLKKALAEKKRLLVIGPWRNQVKLYCRDCETLLTCLECKNEHFDESSSCLNCKKPFNNLSCPNCNSSKIISLGFTYNKITQDLEKLFPCLLDKMSSNPRHFNDSQIIICSPRDVDFLKPTFDIAIFPYFDKMLNFPFLNYRQKLYRLITGLKSLSVSDIFLFTDPKDENQFISQIKNNNWRDFLKSELAERRPLGLPPFKKAVLAVARGKSFVQAGEYLNQFLTGLDKNFKYQDYQKEHTKNLFRVSSLILINYKDFEKFSEIARGNSNSNLHFEVDPNEFA